MFDPATKRSWLASLSKDEFIVLVKELAKELEPIVRDYYARALQDPVIVGVARRLADDPAFQGRLVTAVLLLAAAQVAEDKAAPPVTWVCRCGTVNGVNLETCRVCQRREGGTDGATQP